MTWYSLRGSVIVESLYLHIRVLEAAYNCLFGVAVENLVKKKSCIWQVQGTVSYLQVSRVSLEPFLLFPKKILKHLPHQKVFLLFRPNSPLKYCSQHMIYTGILCKHYITFSPIKSYISHPTESIYTSIQYTTVFKLLVLPSIANEWHMSLILILKILNLTPPSRLYIYMNSEKQFLGN